MLRSLCRVVLLLYVTKRTPVLSALSEVIAGWSAHWRYADPSEAQSAASHLESEAGQAQCTWVEMGRESLPDGTEAALYQLWVRRPGAAWEAADQGEVFVAAPGFDLIASVAGLSAGVRASTAGEEGRLAGPLLHLTLLDLGDGRKSMSRGDRREYVTVHRRPHEFENLGRARKRRYAPGAAGEDPIPTWDVAPLDPNLEAADLLAYIALACLQGGHAEEEAADHLSIYIQAEVMGLPSVQQVPQLQDRVEEIAQDVLTRLLRSWLQPEKGSSLRGYVRQAARGVAASMDTRAERFAATWDDMDTRAMTPAATGKDDDEVLEGKVPQNPTVRRRSTWTVDEAVVETRMGLRSIYRAIKKGQVPIATNGPICLDVEGIKALKSLLKGSERRKEVFELASIVRGTTPAAARVWVNRRLGNGLAWDEIEAELARIHSERT